MIKKHKYLFSYDDRFFKFIKSEKPTFNKFLEYYYEVYDFLKENSKEYSFYIIGSFVNYLHNKLDRLPNELDLIVVGNDIPNLQKIKSILDFLLEKSLKYDFVLDLHYENNFAYEYALSICNNNFEYKRNLKNELYLKNFKSFLSVQNYKEVFRYNGEKTHKEIITGLYKVDNLLTPYFINKIQNHMKNNENYKPIDIFEIQNYNFYKSNQTIM